MTWSYALSGNREKIDWVYWAAQRVEGADLSDLADMNPRVPAIIGRAASTPGLAAARRDTRQMPRLIEGSSSQGEQPQKRIGSAILPDIAVNVVNIRQTISLVIQYARAQKGYTLFTINLDHLVKMSEDYSFRAAYQRADFVTADGWPIVWLLQQEGGKQERTTGADLVEPLCGLAAAYGLPLYVIGPGETSQSKALDMLQARHPSLQIAGAETPRLTLPFQVDTLEALAERIARSGARLCILSLGAPKQEILADELRQRCPGVGFLCVGAALDFISGHKLRAPLWVRHIGMEWLWRLGTDPGRLTARYVKCMLLFARLSYCVTRTKVDARRSPRAHWWQSQSAKRP